VCAAVENLNPKPKAVANEGLFFMGVFGNFLF
jgi:hypothetical protein